MPPESSALAARSDKDNHLKIKDVAQLCCNLVPTKAAADHEAEEVAKNQNQPFVFAPGDPAEIEADVAGRRTNSWK
jgi:hypothetical protein